MWKEPTCRVFAIQSTAPIFDAQVQTSKTMKELRHWRTLKQDVCFPRFPVRLFCKKLGLVSLERQIHDGREPAEGLPPMFDLNLRHFNLHWKYNSTRLCWGWTATVHTLTSNRETSCGTKKTPKNNSETKRRRKAIKNWKILQCTRKTAQSCI